MKRLVVVASLLIPLLVLDGQVMAWEALTQTASASSVVADGKTTITISVTDPQGQYLADLSQGCEPWQIGFSGSGNILNGKSYTGIDDNGGYVTASNGIMNMTYDPSGSQTNGYGTCRGSYTVASTVAQTETATLYGPGMDGWQPDSDTAVTISFTTPPPTAAPVVVKLTPTPKPTPTPPVAPAADTVKVGGATEDTSKPLTVDSSKPLVLSGKTIPNGVVTLTIHSTPRTVTTKADANGNWSYTITGLAAGSHVIYATVTDPVTKQTSPQATLLSFKVTAAKKPMTMTMTPAATKKGSSFTLPAIGLVVLLVIIGLIWYFVRRSRGRAQQPKQDFTVSSAAPNVVDPFAHDDQAETTTPPSFDEVSGDSSKEDSSEPSADVDADSSKDDERPL